MEWNQDVNPSSLVLSATHSTGHSSSSSSSHKGHEGELEKVLRSSRMLKDREQLRKAFPAGADFISKWTPGGPRKARGSGVGKGRLFYPGISGHQTNYRAAAQNKHVAKPGESSPQDTVPVTWVTQPADKSREERGMRHY